MGKKYLLYIHNEKFEQEVQKSALVNLLLDRHYDFYKPGTLVEDVSDESIVGNAELAEMLKPKVESVLRKDNGTCKKHGTPLDYRGHCTQKGCK